MKTMVSPYEDALANLRREFEVGRAQINVVDSIIRNIVNLGGENLAYDFLKIISDYSGEDNAIFSLIHAAEACDDVSYVQALLRAFPSLKSSSPRWASIVLMRILNSASARSEIIRQLRHSPAAVKASVQEVCEAINKVDPRFLSKTVPVTIAAS